MSEVSFLVLLLQIAQWRAIYAVERCRDEHVDLGGEA